MVLTRLGIFMFEARFSLWTKFLIKSTTMAVKDEELRTYIKMLHTLLGVAPVDTKVDSTLFVFLVVPDCCVALPHDATGL